ncbi:MAG: HD-GYP domain-containing protein [Bacilli bacterium]
MKISVEDLKPGFKLLQDVILKGDRVLLYKDTMLTEHHIECLRAFLISKVEIHAANGIKKGIENSMEKVAEINELQSLYLSVVNEFKNEFINLQSGSMIDILRMRELIVPLYEKFFQHKEHINVIINSTNKEDYLYHHCVATGLLSGLIARQMKYSQAECIQLLLGGLLSDAGMSKLPISILKKVSPLTESEKKILLDHPAHSYKLVQKIPSLKSEVKVAMLQHHERLDGSGYPFQVKHDKIHEYAKIIAIGDVYHAMCSERNYKEKRHYIEVLEYFIYDSFGKFDRAVVRALVQIIIHLKQGQNVLLTNGEVGEVKFVDQENPTRPLLFIESRNELVRLQDDRHLRIFEVF